MRKARPSSASSLVLPALIAAFTIILYWPALSAGFVGDDFMILERLRSLAGLGDATRFFRGEFFEYYRPLGFVSHALDWSLAGAAARQFHLTNLMLHVVNTMLVLLIGRALAPGSAAGPIAALLFAFHAANHEAVFWISARFDLLATCGALAGVWWMVRKGSGNPWVPALFFFPALLSKESVVALPIAAGAWAVFRLRTTTTETVTRVAPWIVALATYAILRQLAGGVSAIGGPARVPKLVVLAGIVLILVAAADERWLRIRRWLRERRLVVAGVFVVVLAASAVAAASFDGVLGQFVREKLSVAGFTVWYLTSPIVDVGLPPFYLDPTTPVYWIGGLSALIAMGLALWLLWPRVLDDDRVLFLGAMFLATLIPISALTEGKRYLYLPSAAVSLMVAILIADLGHARAESRAYGSRILRAVFAIIALYVAISIWQIWRKGDDWIWAGRMTSDGARLVDAALAPACGEGHVVFLTSPVAIRDVYTHFYYETFALSRGCMPELFQILVRVVRLDTHVDVRWDGPSRIVLTVPAYRGNFVLSRDLRHFDLPLRASRTATVQTPVGELRAEPAGAGERFTLTLSPDVRKDRVLFFYYSDGEIRRLSASPPSALFLLTALTL